MDKHFVLIYSPKNSARLEYTFNLVFFNLIGLPWKTTQVLEDLKLHDGPTINYSETWIESAILIRPAGLLFEKGISQPHFQWESFEGYPAPYAVSGDSDFPFDIFSAVFFLVSRYEEYLPHIKDQHDRFVPAQSYSHEKKIMEVPVVNRWVRKLKECMLQKWPGISLPEKNFSWLVSVDVDSIYAFKEKGLVRMLGALISDVFAQKWKRVKFRMEVLLGFKPDPFDTFSWMKNIQQEKQIPFIYFFLMGEYGPFDKNLSTDNARFRQVIKSVNDYARVGIHPSYASGENKEKVEKEVNLLSGILNRKVTSSRQHFLRMQFPETYRRLIAAGIRNDYTMGFASEPGFRAGICSPFAFYDLDAETETGLMIFPFSLMDGTLKDVLKFSSEDALKKIKELAETVKQEGGLFISLWHNHSFDESGEWKGWRDVFLEMCEYCKQLEK